MNKVIRIKCLLTFVISFFFLNAAFAQLTANAGTGKVICPGVSFPLGATPAATGGYPPYKYSWWPDTFLSSTTIANPTCSPTEGVGYVLTVTDDSGNVSTSSVDISMAYLNNIAAGADTTICFGDSCTIGGFANNADNGITYSWTPNTSINDSAAPRPLVQPTQTTTYNLSASSAGCPPITDDILVTVIPTPLINAGPDITITEGENVSLKASGGSFYEWRPYDEYNQVLLKYPFTENPDVEPTDTMDFYLRGWDATKQCIAFDTITVNVIPSQQVVFYNTFTPNDDGNNDFWYIGNIEKFPDSKLEIYNRYGKLVFKTKGYENLWNGNTFTGRSFGEKLPSATYFYIMDLGDGGEKYHGTLTIIE